MALLTGTTMVAVMPSLMWAMYASEAVNAAIDAGGAAVFVASVRQVRSQATAGDVARMKAMIPHHSRAILTSERSYIVDRRVAELARGIIETQRREIDELGD